jgi:hypothetical protein
MTSLIERRFRPLATAVLLLLAAPAAGAAQRAGGIPTAPGDLARADALLKSGRVEAAEALYYREARRRPRDPAARLALGRYLASRGATRIGAVLIEEARFFGANPAVAALHLAPLYARLGDYKALALLPSAPISAGERARAEWLVKNPSSVVGPESLTVALSPPPSDTLPVLGTVVITIDGQPIVAEVDPTATGLVLDTSRAHSPSTRAFGSQPTAVQAGSPTPPTAVQAGTPAIPAVVLRAQLGTLAFTNIAVSLEPLGSPSRARIGLDLLGRFSPTFYPNGGRLVLRRSGKVPRLLPGERVPLLVEPRSSWVVWGGRPEPLSGDSVTRRLRTARWTLDAKRGEIILQS